MGNALVHNTSLKYLNKRYIQNNCDVLTIIEYFNAQNVTIKFDDGTILTNKQIGHIVRGSIKNPNKPKYSNTEKKTLYGVGCMGVGKYNSNHIFYQIWSNMFVRCYDKNSLAKYSSYIGCVVSEKWHDFQNFCIWCESNYVEGFVLDKDIILKGNKIYSEENCCFVPQQINNLLCLSNRKRGEYPIGVGFDKTKRRYTTNISIDGKLHGFKNSDTPEEAFEIYKTAKEQYVKTIAERWKTKISEKCFNSLVNYKVEITD